jgi:hypothetical protein
MSTGSLSILRGPAAIVAALAACAALFGCQTPLDRAWGVSHRAHIAQQTAHPDAGLRNPAGPRVDGTSTDAALTKDRVHETKTNESQSSETIINVGH